MIYETKKAKYFFSNQQGRDCKHQDWRLRVDFVLYQVGMGILELKSALQDSNDQQDNVLAEQYLHLRQRKKK